MYYLKSLSYKKESILLIDNRILQFWSLFEQGGFSIK